MTVHLNIQLAYSTDNIFPPLTTADIMNQRPRLAWELYLKLETSADSVNLLNLIANDCYKVSVTTCPLYQWKNLKQN